MSKKGNKKRTAGSANAPLSQDTTSSVVSFGGVAKTQNKNRVRRHATASTEAFGSAISITADPQKVKKAVDVLKQANKVVTTRTAEQGVARSIFGTIAGIAQRQASPGEAPVFRRSNERGASLYYENGGRTLRLSNHSANASNFKSQDDNVSVAIIRSRNSSGKFQADENVNAVEYMFSARYLDQHPAKLLGLLDDISRYIETGEYHDTVGAANTFISGSPEFKTKQEARIEADAVARGEKVDRTETEDGVRFSLFRNIPSKTTDDKNTRRHYDTQIGTGLYKGDEKQRIALLADANGYVPVSNDKDLKSVRADIDTQGYEVAEKKFDAAFDVFTDVNVNQMHRSIALGETLLADAAKRGDFEAVERIVTKLSAMGTVAGQTLQAFSMIRMLSPAGKLAALDAQLAMLNKQLAKKHKSLKPFVPIGISDTWRNAYAEATTAEEQKAVMDNIVAYCASQIESTVGDKVQAWRYMSMLANVKTNVRNVVSNAAMFTMAGMKDFAGAIMEGAVAKHISPENRTKAILNPRSARDTALTKFAKDYFKNVAVDAVASGGKTGFTSQVMDKARVFNSGVLEGARKLSSTALEGADKAFLGARYTVTFAQAAKARGYTAEFLESGTPEAIQALHRLDAYATSEAQKATFRDANMLATYMSKIEGMNWLSKIAVGGTVPFKKTPMNVLKRGLEYSPAGIVRGLYEMASMARTNYGNKKYGTANEAKYTAAQVVDSMAAGLTGTGAATLGFVLACMGLIQAGGDEDERKESYETYTLNEQNYALVLGDMRISIDWISPASMPLFMGVALADMLGAGDDGTGFTQEKLLRAIGNLSQPVFEQSFLSGLTNVLKSAGQSPNMVIEAVTSVAESYLGQFVPTLANQVARAADPYRRNASYVSGDARWGGVQQFGQKMLNKIPGASYLLPQSVDAWGREEKITGGNFFGRLFLSAASPANVSFVEPTAVDQELMRLASEIGNSQPLPDNYHSETTIEYKVDDEKVNKTFQLTPEEKEAYDKTWGTAAFDALDDMLTSQTYKRMDPAEKAKAVDAAYDYADVVAQYEYAKKHKLDMEKPDELVVAEGAHKVGLEIGSVLAVKKKLNMFNAKDEYGQSVNGLKKKRQREYINGLTLTAAQKKFLLETYVDKKEDDETKTNTNKVTRTGKTLR